MTRSCLVSALLCVVCFSAAAQDPSYYRKLDTWQHTLQASIESLNAHSERGGPPPVVYGEWSSIGPFI